MTHIAIIGAGFVADYYVTTLANYPYLTIRGVYDRDCERLAAFCRHHGFRAYDGLDDVLLDPQVEILVNLTTPDSHYEINLAALKAGKHVYCEKPLGMTVEQVRNVVDLAERERRIIASAPANALSDAQALVAKLIAAGKIGKVRLIHAEMEDGPIFRDNWRQWRSLSGAPWPGLHEFQLGCTLEHAGYILSWLVSLFGPVKVIHAFSSLTFPNKGPETENLTLGPDHAVGALEFVSGPVARITCGLAAPRNRSMTIVGDEGILVLRDLWDHRSPVHLSRFEERKRFIERLAGWCERRTGHALPFRLTPGRLEPYPEKTNRRKLPAFPSRIDFSAGIDALARAIGTGKEPQCFSGARAKHLNELALALNSGAGRVEFEIDFDF